MLVKLKYVNVNILWLQDILLIKSYGVVVRSLNPHCGRVKAANYCRNFSLEFVTKTKACKGADQKWARESHSCSQKCKKVGGNELSHSLVNFHFGSWTPSGFSNLQKTITGMKTHWIETLSTSLERS
jgi:hypothetical protein